MRGDTRGGIPRDPPSSRAFSCSAESLLLSASIDRASLECGLVEALADMQALEHEFEHRDPHRVGVRLAEALARAFDAAKLGECLGVMGDGVLIADLDGEAAAIEALHQVAELLDREVPAEHVVARSPNQLLEHRTIIAVLPCLELDLSGRGGRQGGKIADARDRLPFPGAQRTAQGAGSEVLVVRGREPDRYAA